MLHSNTVSAFAPLHEWSQRCVCSYGINCMSEHGSDLATSAAQSGCNVLCAWRPSIAGCMCCERSKSLLTHSVSSDWDLKRPSHALMIDNKQAHRIQSQASTMPSKLPSVYEQLLRQLGASHTGTWCTPPHTNPTPSPNNNQTATHQTNDQMTNNKDQKAWVSCTFTAHSVPGGHAQGTD